jgi:hypothetical protein
MATITRIYTIKFRDNGQKKLYVKWSNGARTECDSEKAVSSTHMRELVAAAQRRGLKLEHEVW